MHLTKRRRSSILKAFVSIILVALLSTACAEQKQGTLNPGATDPGTTFGYHARSNGRDVVFAGAFMENLSQSDALVLESVSLEGANGLTLVDAFVTTTDQQLNGAAVPLLPTDIDHNRDLDAWNAKVPMKGFEFPPGETLILALVLHRTTQVCGRIDGFVTTYTQFGQRYEARGEADVVVYPADKYEDDETCEYD